MKNLLTAKDFPLKVPIQAKVFQSYDELDRVAKQRGFVSVETRDDETVETPCFVGLQNSNLHCGWIATMRDSSVHPEAQIELLNTKVKKVKERDDVRVGFAQTGHFSVGYSIYTKEGRKDNEQTT